VTGGSRGIGRAISVALARHGAAVAVNYRRDAAAAEQLAAELTAASRSTRAFRASLESNEQIEDMVGAVIAELGPPDIVVNCAGVASRGQPVADTDPAELTRLMAVNAFGPHRLAQLVIPGMRKRGLGHIVMISSTATRVMGANGAPYNMAKAAMEALAYTLAAEEERYGIRVNVVAPGLVETEMGRRMARAVHGVADMSALDAASPFGRVCQPEDVAGVVAFLVGPAAGYVTGQRIAVDGGAERSNRLATPASQHSTRVST
jgi:NAD(P)-dependent dehydrogenase (short-subunit alcohol dehydrogenase family)